MSTDHRLEHVVRSEWTKFASLRSSRWPLAAFVVGTLAVGVATSAVSGSNWLHKSAAARAQWDPTNMSLAGLAFGALVLPVLGVLMMSSEYSTGSIRSTLAAVPQRRLVLTAKAIVIGTVALAVGEAVTFATFLAGQRAMGSAPHASLGQPGVFQAVALSGAYLALLGLFGLGLGAIVRRSAWAITAYAGTVLLPTMLVAMPGHPARFGPLIILGNSIGVVKLQHPFLSPWAGFAVMVLYAAAALLAGGVLLVKRDA
jgi:hypothetical protein